MNTKLFVSLGITAAVLLLIACGLIIVREKFPVTITPPPPTTSDTPPQNGEPLLIAHSFATGTHKYKAVIEVPTPCHRIKDGVLLLESYPEQIVLEYTITEPDPETFCAQVISNALVSTDVMASEEARLTSVKINGTPVAFDITEE